MNWWKKQELQDTVLSVKIETIQNLLDIKKGEHFNAPLPYYN